MKRDKAIEAMDKLIELGYSVQVTGSPCPMGHTQNDGTTDPDFQLDVSSFGLDKIDVKKLTEVGEELDLDIGARGALTFMEPDHRPEVIRTQRRHPR